MRFHNGGVAYVSAKNSAGYQDIEIIGKKMNEMIGRSYKDILETDF